MLQTQTCTYDIDDYYEHIKSANRSSNSISFGRCITSIWDKFGLNKFSKLTSKLRGIRQAIYGKNDAMINYGLDHLLENEIEFKRLYQTLSDEKSRRTLMCILKYRLNGDYNVLHAESDFIFNQYFDKDIMQFTDSEVFVDCGGFIGDSTEMFIRRVKKFASIYTYEPDLSNYDAAKCYLSTWEKDVFHKINLRNAGVGMKSATLKLNSGAGASSHFEDTGDVNVRIVSIDDDINEPVSFIKMDVEGFELDAIAGAQNHITNDKPKLGICVYHKPNDLWEIPKTLLELNPSYKLYLRQYKYGDGLNDWEAVIYAV